MLIHQIHELYQLLESDALSLLYLGDESDLMTDKLIRINDENLKQQQQTQLGRRMAFLIAESFQNIVRHHQPAANGTNEKVPNMFMLRHSHNEITISSANRIASSKVESLEMQLQHLNTLGESQLKKMYIGALPDLERTEGGGAGLGLIEMARKTGKPFAYSFEPLEDKLLSIFFFQLKLNLFDPDPDTHTISGMHKMYDIMQKEQVLLLYRSNFAQESMLPVMHMIEHNVSIWQPNKFKQKSTLYILVELFQNIMKHAAHHHEKQDGVLVLARRNEKFLLSTGNFINNNEIPSLQNHLEHINSLNSEQLQQYYKQELTNERLNIKGGAGVGLIETARYGNLPYNFSFISAHSGYSFFTLCIEV